jgi:hypothetical protein
MKIEEAQAYTISDEGMISFTETVLDDVDKVVMLRANLREINNLDMHLNGFDDRNKFRAWCRKELRQETKKHRVLNFCFPASRIKNRCVSCRCKLGSNFHDYVVNNIIRGNYCHNCNMQYGM